MVFWDAGISLLALLALCVFYTRRGLGAALAPLCAVGTAVLWLCACALLGFLLPGAFLFAAFALALGIFTLMKIGVKKALAPLLSPGFLFFTVLTVLALFWFGLRQPVFSQWDEFSFWGTAVKLMKGTEDLYTRAETGWFWTSTEMPALPILSWFMQFLGAAFAPWKVYFAYSVLLFACFAAMVQGLKKRPGAALCVLVCCVLLPFFFLNAQRANTLSTAYLSAYGDLPAGLLFGGALAVYFALRAEGKNALWALLPLGMLALVKDNTFPIALVAAALMAADTLCFCPAAPGRRQKLLKTGQMAAYFALPVLAYLVWKQHAADASAQNLATGGQATGASPFAALGQSLAQLFGLQPKSEGFSRTLGQMQAVFTDGKNLPVSMAGSVFATLLVILVLFALAILLASGRTARLRVALAAGLSTTGFFGFQFVLLTYFAFLNKYQGGLPDYARYSASYLAGWLMLALLLLAFCARGRVFMPEGGRTGRALAAQALTLGCAVAALCLFAVKVLPGYSVLDYPGRLYAPLKQQQAEAEALAAQVEPGARTFYVNQGDDGLGWFKTHQYFLPRILDYSQGGGTLSPLATGVPYEIVMGRAELEKYLEEHDCTYIYIEGLDEGFIKNYGTLFTDGLAGFEEGSPELYRRAGDGRYAPVREGRQ